MPRNSSKKAQNKPKLALSTQLINIGTYFIGLGLFLFLVIFFPVIKEEVKYLFNKPNLKSKQTIIQPIDKKFGIVIPKIKANAKIIANVNPYDPKEYQVKLTKGVAHAKGTSLPDEDGNIFLFAHSSANFYQANRFNSVFYLINKLESNDDIEIYYKEKKYTYKVTGKRIVDATEIDYIEVKRPEQTLVLMTCWPAGTTLKRLIVTAEISKK